MHAPVYTPINVHSQDLTTKAPWCLYQIGCTGSYRDPWISLWITLGYGGCGSMQDHTWTQSTSHHPTHFNKHTLTRARTHTHTCTMEVCCISNRVVGSCMLFGARKLAWPLKLAGKFFCHFSCAWKVLLWKILIRKDGKNTGKR